MPTTPHEPVGQLAFQQLTFAEPVSDNGKDTFEASVAKAMEGLVEEESASFGVVSCSLPDGALCSELRRAAPSARRPSHAELVRTPAL